MKTPAQLEAQYNRIEKRLDEIGRREGWRSPNYRRLSNRTDNAYRAVKNSMQAAYYGVTGKEVSDYGIVDNDFENHRFGVQQRQGSLKGRGIAQAYAAYDGTSAKALSNG